MESLDKELILSLKEFAKKDISKSVWQIVTSFGPFLLLWTLSYLLWDISFLLSAVILIVNAFFTVRIFIIQHDAGHRSYFDPRYFGKLNELIGWVCSVFTTLPYTYWSVVHQHHHTHTGQLEERDIGDLNFMTTEEYQRAGKLKKLGYRLFRTPFVLFIIAPIFYFLFSNRWPMFFSFEKMNIKVRWSQVANNLLLLAIYLLGVIFLGWKFIAVQGITIFLFSIIAFWFFYVQHAHEFSYQRWRERGEWEYIPAALQGASRYDIHPVFHWLSGNIGFHHLHHLNPAIPSYHLREADKATFTKLKWMINNLSFRQSLSCINNKLWDEDQSKFVTFREFYEMKRRD